MLVEWYEGLFFRIDLSGWEERVYGARLTLLLRFTAGMGFPDSFGLQAHSRSRKRRLPLPSARTQILSLSQCRKADLGYTKEFAVGAPASGIAPHTDGLLFTTRVENIPIRTIDCDPPNKFSLYEVHPSYLKVANGQWNLLFKNVGSYYILAGGLHG